jgi:biopolymer transport protein ExbD
MRAHASPEPNVTPMIDVLLVLLIIFMAAIPEQRRAIVGQLPQNEASASSGQPSIVLEVAAGGRYRLNRRAVADGKLADALRTIYNGRPDKTLIVRGDRAARYQEVVTAVDVARGVGVRVVGIDTRR